LRARIPFNQILSIPMRALLIIIFLFLSAPILAQEKYETPSESNSVVIISIIVTTCVIGLVAFFYVRTQDRKNQKQLNAYKDVAAKAQKTLEEREKFLAYTNHEIRTPLNAVSGSAELLFNSALNTSQEKYVKTIKASVDNVLVLVNDVLDLSRIESGNIEFRKDDFLISDVLMSISYILQEKAERKGIKLHVTIDDNIPTVLKGDARYLNQILINLCNNAVKFTDLGKVELCAQLIREHEDTVDLSFKIIDTGKGIRKSKISTIFNHFEQETHHTIQHKGGSGLGLAITKQLVESLNGNISLDSKYLEGTTFTVDLTFNKSNGGQINKNKIDTRILQGLKVLVVDDNLLNREIVRDVLSELNPECQVYMAESGEVAIEYVKEKALDLVLMDIQMPQMDGYETTQFIRKNVRHPFNEVPIVAMTAYAMEDVAQTCFQAGMNDYITKPINWQFLLTKIQRLKEKQTSKASRLKLDHIDLGNLKRLTLGDNTKMFKYIDIFLSSVPTDLAAIKVSVKNHDLSSALQILHKIKGNTVYMGNTEVSDIYDELYSQDPSIREVSKFLKAIEISEKCLEEIKEVKKNYKLLFLEIK